MTDREKMQNLIDATRMTMREFALEIGLDSAQPIYDIMSEKYGISKRMARLISDKFPELVTFEDLRPSGKVQIGNKGVNIQADNSTISTTADSKEALKVENRLLRETIKRLEKELDEYRSREKTFLNLLTHEAKKS
jgi:hypothetical protein